MAWWHPDEIKVTHLPTGHVVRVEVSNHRWRKAREAAMRMLRSKVAAPVEMGPADIVRCYEVPDGAWTTPELDGGVYVRRK